MKIRKKHDFHSRRWAVLAQLRALRRLQLLVRGKISFIGQVWLYTYIEAYGPEGFGPY